MVRVSGSLSDSGFYRESPQKDTQSEFGQGNEASTNIGSPTTPLKQDRSAERQSFGRSSTDGTEETPVMDLEDKPRPPPQVPSGTPAGLDENLDPPDESPPAQAGTNTSIQPRSGRSMPKKKTAKSKPSRKKIKAPDSETKDRGDRMSDDQLTKAYYKKELHTTGIIAESFEAEALFDLKLSEIKQSVHSLFELLAPLVSEPDQAQKQPTQSESSATRSTLTVARSTPIVAPGDQTAASSPYVSATVEVESSDSEEPPRMTLGPAGAAMLQNRAKQTAGRTTINPKDTLEAMVNSNRHPPEKLESFFQATMERFLKEQQVPQTRPKPRSTGDQDVEMELVGSPDQPTTAWEYDPDDLDLGRPARATVATTTATTSNQAINTPRIRVSAMSGLKEVAGKDGDEDRARSWLGKVKSAFIRDQAPDQDKCLVFGDLLTGPARNWYHQLSRTTRSTWKDLHQRFQVQYCGRGVSVARQYYHARKRSDESPLEYLHRLNVAGLRTRLQIKDGPQEVRREHVEYFIETLDDRNLADQLALLRIPDADILEEVLRSRQRAKARQSKKVYGSIKPRQKSPAAAAGTRAVRAVHVPEDSSDSDEESRSSSDEDLRRVYLASRSPQDKPQDQRIRDQTQAPHHQDRHFSQYPRQTDEGTPSKRCSHCGSRKHDDLGCWRRLTWQDRTDAFSCAEHVARSMKLASARWRNFTTRSAMRSRFCIYAYVEKQSKAAVNKVIDNTCDLEKESATAIANLHQTDEYSRSEVKMILDISSGESRGYWKYLKKVVLGSCTWKLSLGHRRGLERGEGRHLRG
ncbi:unnamed protein product [Phytophthora fragariaefolia]|uniref:Unnamed protein product n=1 Tax=Phytophthora fragariaefolia TaxID=1490495 RepID=A0A9W6XVN5_9STRA|nr:unnamed protein product [Phytophthora fragariaefolia]